jgi:hypothetical protein
MPRYFHTAQRRMEEVEAAQAGEVADHPSHHARQWSPLAVVVAAVFVRRPLQLHLPCRQL